MPSSESSTYSGGTTDNVQVNDYGELAPEIPTAHVGTQCCCDRPMKYIITANASTQTDNIPDTVEEANNCLPIEKPGCVDLSQAKHDHTYAKSNTCDDSQSQQKSVEPRESGQELLDDKAETNIDMDFDDDINDTDFIPSQDYQSSTDTDSDPENVEADYVEEPKYLVFNSSLTQLFKYCMNCGGIVVDVKYSVTGRLVSVTTTCMKGHEATWNSQPILNNHSPVGNLLISSSILFTGNTFNAIKNFASCLNMKLFSERSFYHIQDRYL